MFATTARAAVAFERSQACAAHQHGRMWDEACDDVTQKLRELKGIDPEGDARITYCEARGINPLCLHVTNEAVYEAWIHQ